MPSKTPPISIRLPEALRNRVAEYASKHELAFNAAVKTLLEQALTPGARPARAAVSEPIPFPPNQTATIPTGPAYKKQAEAAKQKPRTATDGMCEHRVPKTSFCIRCHA